MKKFVFVFLYLALIAGTAFAQLSDEQMYIFLCREAQIFLEEEGYEDAIEYATAAIRLMPNIHAAYSVRGNAYLSLFEYDRAIADFSEVIRFAPNNVLGYFSRGIAYKWKGDWARAIADLEAALRINPNNAAVRESLEEVRSWQRAASGSSSSAPQAVPAGFVRINGGTFTMGSPANEAGRQSNEIQRQVTVSSFHMGIYPVTQREYREVMGTNQSHFRGDNLPVENVSWFDAVEYCNRRSQREGLTSAYTISGSGNNRTVTWNRNANGYRLPTEAEWEYACRAGTTTAYNTGVSINTNQANFNNTLGRTTPVGNYPANRWGLYDMHGNVSEWCWDWFGMYASGVQTNPTGAVSGSFRVLRGGSWRIGGSILRSAYRVNYGLPGGRDDVVGLRLVRP